jgi:hypothetical protein
MEVTAARRLPPRAAGWVLGAALVLAIAAGAVLLLRPAGRSTPEAAARAAAGSPTGRVEVIASRTWGQGRLIVTGFHTARDARRLGLAFTIDRGRGWRVAGYTEEQAATSDVGVGSLLVAASPGGAGQPSWSAAYGELSAGDAAVVEVEWADGTTTRGTPRNGAYLVVRQGEVQAKEVRYLRTDRSVLARVPV